MSAVKTSVPVACWRTRAPRQNSWLIVPTTKPRKREAEAGAPDAHAERHDDAADDQRRSRPGTRNWSRRLTSVDLRHASSGPTPVSSSSVSPIGSIHWLKNGGADREALAASPPR